MGQIDTAQHYHRLGFSAGEVLFYLFRNHSEQSGRDEDTDKRSGHPSIIALHQRQIIARAKTENALKGRR
jgi:hypothetical protein